MMTRASKRGRALSGKPFVSHRADRDYASTVLSVLAGAHSVGAGILGFFDTREAGAIRLICTEFRDAVAAVPWEDEQTRISRNVGGWRACYPRATKANISVEFSEPQLHNAIVDADFVHFEGIHTLDMSFCSQAGITDAAFVHLKMHKVGVDDRIVLLRRTVRDGDVRLRCARVARAPPTHVPRDARLHVRPRDGRDGIAKFHADEPNRARLARVEEAEDARAHAVRAREHREHG